MRINKQISRRQALGSIGIGLATPLVLGHPNALAEPFALLLPPNGTDGVTWIQLDDKINLNADSVYDFIASPDTIYKGPTPSVDGFSLMGSPKVAGQIDKELYAARREYYSVRRGTRVIGNFNVIVTMKQVVTITVSTSILVRDQNVSPAVKAKIVKGFNDYDPTQNPDPVKYALENLGSDVTPDMFVIRPSFTLTKKGSAVPFDTKQRDALRALYEGTAQGQIFVVPGQDSLSQYFSKNLGLTVVYLKDEAVGRVPAPQQDLIHERTVKHFDDQIEIDKVLDDVTNTEWKGMDCTDIATREESKIATLLLWPEFKVDWQDIPIKIGCVTVVISIPIPRARISRKVLYAYVAHAKNLDQTIINALKWCLIKAAIGGTVIGIVLANFAAGFAAFEALFDDCVNYEAAQIVGCLIPGLEILTESDKWVP